MNPSSPESPGVPTASGEPAPFGSSNPTSVCPARRVETGPVAQGEAAPVAGFVALSRFVIANGMSPQVRAAFCQRPHLVDEAPGYRHMEVMSPLGCPEEIWLLTFWTDEASFRTWHRSHVFRDSHKGIPRGLKLVPKASEVRCFEHLAS